MSSSGRMVDVSSRVKTEDDGFIRFAKKNDQQALGIFVQTLNIDPYFNLWRLHKANNMKRWVSHTIKRQSIQTLRQSHAPGSKYDELFKHNISQQ